MSRRTCTQEEFRAGLSRWCTGVCVVTVCEADRRHGMTVSAFASVDLDPPTVLVSLYTASRTAAMVSRSGRFVVNILSAGQSSIAERFAGRNGDEDRFVGIAVREGRGGVPLIEQTVGNLECEVVDQVVRGDHTVYFAAVCEVHASDVDPLLYFRGQYQEIVYGRRTTSR